MRSGGTTQQIRRRQSARPRRGVAAAAGAIALTAAALVVVMPSGPAQAIPPFPIIDNTDGVPGETNPNWESVVTGDSATGNVYTTDQWLRLTSAGTNQAANILNDIPFPSTTGFVVDFDYRQAGGIAHTGDAFPARTGDGMSMYLVDGDAPVSAGGTGGGLGYAGCGVQGGYLGVGLDTYGNFAVPSSTATGGPGTNPSMIGVRGSGTTPCLFPGINYPWVDGASVPGLWTGTPGDLGDPADQADSLYRHVRVQVSPSAGAITVSIAISAAVAKDQPFGELTPVLSVDLAGVPGQAPLPPTLKLGFGASTGGATDFHDIRRVRVSAYTDAAITKTLSAATPGNPAIAPGQFLPGDPIAFTVTAVNNGPTDIGNAPGGVARVFDDLSGVPLTGVTWTCAGSGGGVCLTAAGSGPVVSVDWTAPVGGAVTVEISATIPLDAPTGVRSNTAVIPTDFDTNTVGPPGSGVQQDEATVDSEPANNTASAQFEVSRPFFSVLKFADAAAYAVGQPVTYTVLVYNSNAAPGAASVSDTVPSTVAVNDATCTASGGSTCSVSVAGDEMSGTVAAAGGGSAFFTITGTAIAVGSAVNSVTATPTTPYCATGCGGGTATTGPAAVVPTELSLTKTAVSDGLPVTELALGMPIEYRYHVSNTGEYVLENVTVEELSFTGSGTLPPPSCAQTTLQPGASMTCTAPYVVTQDDLDGGLVHNTAQASGNAPGSAVMTLSPEASLSLPVPASPGLSLTKSAEVTDANGSRRTDPGDVVTWTFTATNSGDITLHELTIDDPLAGVVACDALTLAPAAVATCRSLPQTITAGDALSGSIVNRATATATDPRGTVTSEEATATVVVAVPPKPPGPPGPPAPPTQPQPGGAATDGSEALAATGSAAAGPTLLLSAVGLLAVGAGAIVRRRAHRTGRVES